MEVLMIVESMKVVAIFSNCMGVLSLSFLNLAVTVEQRKVSRFHQ